MLFTYVHNKCSCVSEVRKDTGIEDAWGDAGIRGFELNKSQ